jgi:hypothetical protein
MTLQMVIHQGNHNMETAIDIIILNSQCDNDVPVELTVIVGDYIT